MERSIQDIAPSAIHAVAASLVRGLACWDVEATSHPPQEFVDALTSLSALGADALDMEIRRLVIDADGTHLLHLVAALSHRDVPLKCKVANAVGSLCTSRVAGQRLLELHGDALIASLGRMAQSKNTWAQADAVFVFGWIVVIGEDAMVEQHLVPFISTVIKLLARNLEHKIGMLDEQDANLRIYCLVFLLNFSQRNVNALEHDLVSLFDTLHVLVTRLVDVTSALVDRNDRQEDVEESISEHLELVLLAVTLLDAVVVQLDTAPSMVLTLNMLPPLLQLEETLQRDEVITALRQGHRDDGEDEEGIAEPADLSKHIQSIKATVLAQR